MSEQQIRWDYVECTEQSPPDGLNIENLIPKCRILVQIGKFKTIF